MRFRVRAFVCVFCIVQLLSSNRQHKDRTKSIAGFTQVCVEVCCAELNILPNLLLCCSGLEPTEEAIQTLMNPLTCYIALCCPEPENKKRNLEYCLTFVLRYVVADYIYCQEETKICPRISGVTKRLV